MELEEVGTPEETPVFDGWDGAEGVGKLAYLQDKDESDDEFDDKFDGENSGKHAWVAKDALVRITDEYGNQDDSAGIFVVVKHDAERNSVRLKSVEHPDHSVLTREFDAVIYINRYQVDDYIRIIEDGPHFGKVGKVLFEATDPSATKPDDFDEDKDEDGRPLSPGRPRRTWEPPLEVTIELSASPGETITVPANTSLCRMKPP